MAETDLARSFPRLTLTPPIHLWDEFFFMPIDAPLLEEAQTLARRISAISRGRRTLVLSESADVIGKVGEFVIRAYCEQNLTPGSWRSYVEEVNPKGGDICDLSIAGLKIDVKTRQLHSDVTIAPNFDLRVPETEGSRPMDIFVLAGYCPSSRYGYAFGWCTGAELKERPVRTDIRYPARCMPLTELRPMTSLEAYAGKQGEATG